MVVTLLLCMSCRSQQTVTFALYIMNGLGFITEMEGVYCAVWTESLYNTDMFHHLLSYLLHGPESFLSS